MNESSEYLTGQIITYIGNKRSLLPLIGKAVVKVSEAVGRNKMRLFDVFSGSGVVSRYFKQFASELYSNDLETYSRICNECYLSNAGRMAGVFTRQDLDGFRKRVEENMAPGFISEMYAPKDDGNIKPGERAFYTTRNAMYIDTAMREIDGMPEEARKYLMAPLLYSASVHCNTSGVFKGFYKGRDGVGKFGGEAGNALFRILGSVEVEYPVMSRFDCDSVVFQKDAVEAAESMPCEVDLAYLDPPYNQHPYGSNYFMLNLIAEGRRPEKVSGVSGIPEDWNRSAYNRKKDAWNELQRLVSALRAKYVAISYNSDGFVSYDEFVDGLSRLGRLDVFDTEYNTFRGCRNLHSRDMHVREYLFLLERE